MLRQADFLVVLSPRAAGRGLTGLRGLIGERELALMKPTAVLVGAGAGGLVDQRALYHALSEGKLFGAGLDVYEAEPISILDPIIRLPNMIALPHMGSATLKTRTAMANSAAENLTAALEGELPVNLVNPEVIDILASRPLDIIAPVRDVSRQARDVARQERDITPLM
jgi:glyoxylate reductase